MKKKASSGSASRNGRASAKPRSAPGAGRTSAACRRAAVVLEVLAGIRTPTAAAQVLGISVNYYYLLERKALAGLVAACEPAPRGPGPPSLERQVERLERALAQCHRECQRQAALVRTTQRAVGLPAAGGNSRSGKQPPTGQRPRRRRRQPVVRALRAAEALQQNSSGQKEGQVLEQEATDVRAAEQARSPVAAQERHDGTAG